MKYLLAIFLFAITACSPPAPGEPDTAYKIGYFIGSVIGARLAGALYGGVPVYAPSECIGPIVNGVCEGSVIDTMPNRPVCHGTMLNGVCTGPMF